MKVKVRTTTKRGRKRLLQIGGRNIFLQKILKPGSGKRPKPTTRCSPMMKILMKILQTITKQKLKENQGSKTYFSLKFIGYFSPEVNSSNLYVFFSDTYHRQGLEMLSWVYWQNESKLFWAIIFEIKLLVPPDAVFDSESNGCNFSSLAPPGGEKKIIFNFFFKMTSRVGVGVNIRYFQLK